MRQLSLFCLLLLCCLPAIAQQKVVSGENTFGMSAARTVTVKDPATGNKEQQLIPAHPFTMNGEPVYTTDTITHFPYFKEKGAVGSEKLSGYLFNALKPKLDSLEDGNYMLAFNNTVIDTKGRLVYYEFNGIKKLEEKTVFAQSMQTQPSGKSSSAIAEVKAYDRVESITTEAGIDGALSQSINAATRKILEDMPRMKPAQLNGENVNCTGPVFSTWNFIIVKDHRAVFSPYPDCL